MFRAFRGLNLICVGPWRTLAAPKLLPLPELEKSMMQTLIALVANGIFLLENLRLDELAARQVYECAFIVQPLKIRRGTGSTVAPVAVR